eukprot:SAG25_NODE_838_length_5128_cov_5.187314_3_plen_70_part_00
MAERPAPVRPASGRSGQPPARQALGGGGGRVHSMLRLRILSQLALRAPRCTELDLRRLYSRTMWCTAVL